jgi:hypothetical protein
VTDRTYFILTLKQSEKSLFITVLRDGGHCLTICLEVSISFQKGWILGLTYMGFKQSNFWTAYKKYVNRYTSLIASVDSQYIQIFRFNAILRIISVCNIRSQGVNSSCFYANDRLHCAGELMDYFTSIFTWLETVNGVTQFVESLRYHLDEPIVLKLGSLNFSESSGPVQACTWVL